jgi:magnesium transporter
MLYEAIQPEIRELIEKKNFATLKQALAGLEAADVAELAGELEGQDLGVVFRLLSRDKAAEVFARLPLEGQEGLLGILSGDALAGILNNMPPDDRTELLEELPEDVAGRLIGSLSRDERKVAIDLLQYPEDSIGRLMTPEFVVIKVGWTIAAVLEHIRKVAPEKETLNVIYVVDERGRLIDDLPLEDLVLADPAETVGEIIDRHPVSLSALADREEAVGVFKKYDAVALPVVDEREVLVGIVTIDDVMDVQEAENTEDFLKSVAVVGLEEPYFATTYPEMLWKRLPWLALLFAAELLTVLALTSFERGLEAAVFALVVLFMPLINATAGNTGSQMAGLIIRGLAVREIGPGDWLRVLGRELALGVTMACLLGALGVGASMVIFRYGSGGAGAALQGQLVNALGVGVSIAAAVMVANLAGAMIPLLFKRLGLDPAVTSGPFLASIMDVTGVLIYFSIASAILVAWRH